MKKIKKKKTSMESCYKYIQRLNGKHDTDRKPRWNLSTKMETIKRAKILEMKNTVFELKTLLSLAMY